MTGLDTNVLLRYIVRDDPAQTERADILLQEFTPETPGFISLVALAELFWVLRSFYRMPKAELIVCLERLLNSQNLVLEAGAAVRLAIVKFAGARCDFADCLIERSGFSCGCTRTVTFDANAAKSTGMVLL
jgi:predicted nucleic-acid-binding protein